MSPYEINKLLYDLSPELFNRIKQKDKTVYEEYRLSFEDQLAIKKAVEEEAFNSLYEIGVLPNLIFRLARFCGYGPSEFSNLMKK